MMCRRYMVIAGPSLSCDPPLLYENNLNRLLFRTVTFTIEIKVINTAAVAWKKEHTTEFRAIGIVVSASFSSSMQNNN